MELYPRMKNVISNRQIITPMQYIYICDQIYISLHLLYTTKTTQINHKSMMCCIKRIKSINRTTTFIFVYHHNIQLNQAMVQYIDGDIPLPMPRDLSIVCFVYQLSFPVLDHSRLYAPGHCIVHNVHYTLYTAHRTLCTLYIV